MATAAAHCEAHGGAAWRRRHQRERATARHVGWLTSILQASCSHHTSAASGKSLMGTLASMEQRLLHMEAKLKHEQHQAKDDNIFEQANEELDGAHRAHRGRSRCW